MSPGQTEGGRSPWSSRGTQPRGAEAPRRAKGRGPVGAEHCRGSRTRGRTLPQGRRRSRPRREVWGAAASPPGCPPGARMRPGRPVSVLAVSALPLLKERHRVLGEGAGWFYLGPCVRSLASREEDVSVFHSFIRSSVHSMRASREPAACPALSPSRGGRGDGMCHSCPSAPSSPAPRGPRPPGPGPAGAEAPRLKFNSVSLSAQTHAWHAERQSSGHSRRGSEKKRKKND